MQILFNAQQGWKREAGKPITERSCKYKGSDNSENSNNSDNDKDIISDKDNKNKWK